MPNGCSTYDKKPKFPSVFKLELTPEKPVINSDVPFSMTLKNMSKKAQAVEIEVDSFLFEIMNARAKSWPYSQDYHKVEPGGTLSFQIGVMKETPKDENIRCDIVDRLKTPEGLLKIYHSTVKDMDDTDAGWGYIENEYDQYYILPGYRIRYLNESLTEEHGHDEMELICEKETELTKKRKEKFNEMKMKKVEEEKKRQRKCCSCTVL